MKKGGKVICLGMGTIMGVGIITITIPTITTTKETGTTITTTKVIGRISNRTIENTKISTIKTKGVRGMRGIKTKEGASLTGIKVEATKAEGAEETLPKL